MKLLHLDEEKLIFYVNGKRIEESNVDPLTTLAVYLRDYCLTGTKVGCNEGGCGACTVMISDLDPTTEQIRYFSANSCLTPIGSVFGKAITTVEGIGSVALKRLHPIQERLSIAHGSQCGFCTPGFVMAMYTLLRNNPRPTEEEVDEAIQGNLCRCTGYRPILEAFYSFANDNKASVLDSNTCPMGNNCCKNSVVSNKKISKLTSFTKCQDYDPTQELIFPPEILLQKLNKKSFSFETQEIVWYQPISLIDCLKLKQKIPDARLIHGNTEVGFEQKFRFTKVSAVINPKQIPELREAYLDEEKGAFLGTGLSLTEVRETLDRYIHKVPDEKAGIFRAVHSMLYYFGGKHIRDMAGIAGNIVTASPISDLNPIWMASGASIELASLEREKRLVKLDENFFIGYRKTILQPDEVILGIWIPYTASNEFFQAYKQAQRRDDDITIVTSAFLLQLDKNTRKVEKLKISFGGMASSTKMAAKSTQGLEGYIWDENLIEEISTCLIKEFELESDSPGGRPKYRQALCISFLFKFYLYVCEKIEHAVHNHINGMNGCEKDVDKFSSTQIYYDVPIHQNPQNPVGRPIMHQSGQKHVTGEAIYTGDIEIPGCLFLALVTSNVAAGKIEKIDPSEALKVQDVIAYIDYKDIPGKNLIGTFGDTPVFAEKEVMYYAQPLAAIVAKDHETARRAANLVKVTITPEVPIVTIEQAIEKESFFEHERFELHSSLQKSDLVKKYNWNEYKNVVKGQIRIGGQEHFYLETHNCVVIPGECDEMTVISGTQCVSSVQGEISDVLGIPRHKIDVKVKRVGGAFGGKETTAGMFASATAVAAHKLRRPIRVLVERFDDMAITGTRHPYRFDYQVAIDDDYRLLNLDVQAYSNCGATIDLSGGVMYRTMTAIENVYNIENVDFNGKLCRTNIASSTAFRGFGAPQAMFCTETIMKHIAEEFKIDVNKLREQNMYNEDDVTPYGQRLTKCNIRRCWAECLELSKYETRREEIEQFNKIHKYTKRGIYMMPTMLGIGFAEHKLLNQAGALVHIYTDGSVLISHGGMEMGQGLHTKMLQIAASCLEIDISLVHINNTSSDKVPNASPTAASGSSDLYGLAVQDACNKLNKRLKPFKDAAPNNSWKEWVMAAYSNRVPLSATGFSILPCPNLVNSKEEAPVPYFVYGAASSEVEVDCLTGDHKVLQTYLVMDIGDSLNPAVDIGQIEGAFLQGYGLFTMEELKIRPDGTRLTRGPSTYKIPTADDAPKHFHVKLLKGSSNPYGIFSSKNVGEPPLFLGSSIFFAIREAVRSYRADQGLNGYFRLDSPATPDKIRMSCEDRFTKKVIKLYGNEISDNGQWTVEL